MASYLFMSQTLHRNILKRGIHSKQFAFVKGTDLCISRLKESIEYRRECITSVFVTILDGIKAFATTGF